MHIGDKVRITQGKYKSKVGRVESRHFNVIPKEWEKMKIEVEITRYNETLYSVRLDGEKETMYLPESFLELIVD